jgi:hypothetical protein
MTQGIDQSFARERDGVDFVLVRCLALAQSIFFIFFFIIIAQRSPIAARDSILG